MIDGTDNELEPESPNGASDEDLENTGSGDADESDGSTEEKESKDSSNRFSKLGSRLSDRMRATDDEDDDDEEDLDDDDEDLDDEDADDAQGDEDGSDGKKPQDAKKPKGDEKDDDEDEDSGSSRFEIRDASGSKYELELPDGAEIVFAGDGKDVTVKSIDELVKYAQKGAAFDRVAGTQGQKIGKLSSRITELEDDNKADQELVRQLVTGTIDDETLKLLEEHYELLEKDPETLEAREALREKREREAAEKQPANNGENVARFWGATKEVATEEVGNFEYLEPEDVPEILNAFDKNYRDRREVLVNAFVEEAKQIGINVENERELHAVIREADKAAIDETLNRKTLRRVMREMNDKIAKRAGKVLGSRESQGKKEAEGHNRRIEAQRDRSRNPANRSLRAGGASLNTREPRREKDAPRGFEAKIDKSVSRFSKLRRSLAQQDSDDDE